MKTFNRSALKKIYTYHFIKYFIYKVGKVYTIMYSEIDILIVNVLLTLLTSFGMNAWNTIKYF